MKKIVLLIVAMFLFNMLLAEEHNENELFMIYQQDQTFENFQKAIEHYNSDSENAEDYNSTLMLSYLYTMELDNNLAILNDNLDSLNTRTKFSYANLLLELGKLDESIAVYEKLNENVPKWSCPWRHKGQALLEQKNYKDAEIATRQAIETREDHFDAYLQLARIQKNLGEYEAALQTLENGMQYEEADLEEEVTNEEVELLKAELEQLLETNLK
ncbi:MAG: hypothetical protein PF570_05465 [Candidatus Cloacimonetes bacterium]|jgi:tetratricopeptide (TPR) repeat protein|nr:hypothetical protein [Candidatus Cloacimonadota bacterium]